MLGAFLLTMMLAGSAAGEQGAPLPTQAEAEALAQQGNREEALAAQTCRLTMTDDGQGTTHGRFSLPTAQGAM